MIEDIALAFDSNDACRIAQITTRQLNHWDRLGIASPSIDPGRGSGNRRSYRLGDVIILRLARELRQFGVGLDVVADAIATVRRTGAIASVSPGRDTQSDLDTITLAIGGDGTIAVGDRLDNRLSPESASMIVVRLGRIAERVKRQVSREIETTRLRRTKLKTPMRESMVESSAIEPLGEVGQFEAIANSFIDALGQSESADNMPIVEPNKTKRDVDGFAAERTKVVTPRRSRKRPLAAPNARRRSGASAWGDAW